MNNGMMNFRVDVEKLKSSIFVKFLVEKGKVIYYKAVGQ
jgi:hypothetical protein